MVSWLSNLEAVTERRGCLWGIKMFFEIKRQDIKNIMVWIKFLQSRWNLKMICNIIWYGRTWDFIDHSFQMFKDFLHLVLLTFSQSQQTCKVLYSCLSSAGMWVNEVRADRWGIYLGWCKHIALFIPFGGIHWRFCLCYSTQAVLLHIVNDGRTVAGSDLHKSGLRGWCSSFCRCQHAVDQEYYPTVDSLSPTPLTCL